MRNFGLSTPAFNENSSLENLSNDNKQEFSGSQDPLLPPDVNQFDIGTDSYPVGTDSYPEPVTSEDFLKQDNEP